MQGGEEKEKAAKGETSSEKSTTAYCSTNLILVPTLMIATVRACGRSITHAWKFDFRVY
jgi:hypothetical protein